MRVLWTWSSVAALVVGVIVWSLIFWVCVRYRKRDDELPRQFKENLLVEAVYTILPFFIIAGLFYRTVVVENYVDAKSSKPDVTVTVVGFKWNWQFQYNGHRYAAGTRRRAERERRHHRHVHRDSHPGHPAGSDGSLRRTLRRRHPLVLGARVPVQARRHPRAA